MVQEIATLDANATWELIAFAKGQENNWVQMGVTKSNTMQMDL
jgi:hypothetical protein